MKRIVSLLLSAAMLVSILPFAGAADPAEPVAEPAAENTALGSISATLRVDYPQSLESLQKREIKAELLRDGKSLGTIPLTQEKENIALTGGGSAKVWLRNTDGGELGGGNWPGYLELSASNLPTGAYNLKVTGQGFAPLDEEVELDKFDRHIILGTGDKSFPLGDADNNGQVNEEDRKLVEAALGSAEPKDLERYDLNNDGKIDIFDLACVTRNSVAVSGAEKFETTMLPPVVDAFEINGKPASAEDQESILQDDGNNVIIDLNDKKEANINIELNKPEDMEAIQISTPETTGQIQAGKVVVTIPDGTDEGTQVSYDFDITPPEGTNPISAGVIRIDLGRRVAVKKITITVTKVKEGEYASVSSIRFLQDIVPENPIQPNSTIKNLKAEAGDGQVDLDWGDLPNISGYRVEYWLEGDENKNAEDGKQQKIVDVSNASITGLDNLKLYYFTVTPIDKGWEGKPSAIVTAMPEPASAPKPPDMVSIREDDAKLHVSWKESKNATFYEVFYKGPEDATYKQWGESLEETSVTITGLTNDVEYEVYIISGNAIGRSGKSRISTGTPKATDYSRPEGIPTMGMLDNSKIESVQLLDKGNYNASQYTEDAPFQPENMIDGDFHTHWTASNNWARDEHVVCTFKEPVDLSAAIWVPRLDGSYPNNLRAYSVRVWLDGDDLSGPGTQLIPAPSTGVSDNAGSAHLWPNVTNYASVPTSHFAIMPFGPLKNIKKISVAAEQKGYAVVSCSELMFMEYDETKSLPDEINNLFSSPMYTELANDVTQEKIDALRERLNSDEKNYYLNTDVMEDQLKLAEELLAGETKGSLIYGVDSRSTGADSSAYKQAGSDLQPLGAAALAGKKVVIYASGIPEGETLTVFASQYNAEANAWRAPMGAVSNGQNVFVVPKIGSQNTARGGSLYFSYSGSAPDQIQLHVRMAEKIPMLDMSDWYALGEGARKEAIADYTEQLSSYAGGKFASDSQTNCFNVTEIATPTVLLSLPAAAVNNALGAVAGQDERANTLYKSIEAWEDLMYVCKTTQGIDKNYAENDMQSRQNIRVMQMFAGAFMYAAGNHIGIGYGSCGGMVCGKPISSLPEGAQSNQIFGWGIAHEIGHNMDKLGKAEVTNNIYSLMGQTFDGNQNTFPSRLELSNKYPAVFTKTAQGYPGQSGDVFVQLGMYWQLHLAYDGGDKPMDFYNRFFKAWKSGQYFDGESDYADRFALTASAIANRDLSEFFTRWGMVLSDSTKDALKGYTAETRDIWYLSDQSRRDRLDGKAGASGTVSLRVDPSTEYPNNGFDLSISCSAGKDGIQGYEILRNDDPIAFVLGSEMNYTDIIGSANHRTYVYSVRAIDTLGNCFATAEAPEVRVSYDRTIPEDRYYSIDKDSDTITFNLKDETAVTGMKITNGPLSGNFEVIVTNAEGKTTVARSGNFEKDASLSGDGYLTYFQKPGAAPSDTRIWTYDAKTVVVKFNVAKEAKNIDYAVNSDAQTLDYAVNDDTRNGDYAVSGDTRNIDYAVNVDTRNIAVQSVDAQKLDVQLISYADDDVAFLEGQFAGILSHDFTSSGETIPAGTLVIAGTYQGDPLYLSLKVQGRFIHTHLSGEDSEEVSQGQEERDIDGDMYLFAEVPEDGAVSDISDGIFLFVPNLERESDLQGEVSSCSPQSLLPAQVRVVCFRTDTPDSAETGRQTAETLWMNSPGGTDLPEFILEGGGG